MIILGGQTSRLNPYAQPFVPGAYRAVEDYSPEWWRLVESSVDFRDYWLRECFQAEEEEEDTEFDEPELPDADSLFHSYPPQATVMEEKGGLKDSSRAWDLQMMGWSAEKWRGGGCRPGAAVYMEKAPKYVNVKLSPRTIQQPR